MRLALTLIAALGVAAAAHAVVVPMDAQINTGGSTIQSPSGDAIYVPDFDTSTMSFEADEVPGYTRHHNAGGAWWYQYVDLNLAGIGEMDLSAATANVSFETRYFHSPDTNSNPYGDAPVFLRLYTYADDGTTYEGNRDFGIVYAVNHGDPAHPTWTTVSVDVNGGTGTDSGVFDVTQVSRVRFYGTNWAGTGDDFVDFKNLTVVPEPATMGLLGLAGLALLRRRR